MRICLTTTTKVELKTAQDGSYRIEGYGSHNYMEFARIADQLFYKNFTLFSTTNDEECMDRLRSNQSDVSTAMSPYFGNLKDYQVPVPMFLSRLSFMTGYDFEAKSPKTKECGSVFDNFTLFAPSAYFWTCFLLFVFVTFIAVKTSINWNHKKCFLINLKRLKKRAVHSRFKCTFAQVSKEVRRTFYCTSEQFRLVSLLFVILCFYLVKFFAISYKTSQIIVEEPFVVDSYEKLLGDKDALPAFYDVIARTSEKFQHSPKNTVKGRIWSKLMEANVDVNDFIRGGNNTRKGPDLLALVRRQFKLMDEKHCVLFASSVTINLLRTIYYASSPDGELWRIFVFADESEDEDLLGYPLSNFYENKKYFVARIRRLFEYFIINKFYIKALDASKLGYALTGASKEHQFKQNLICSDDFSHEIHVQVDGIRVNYFRSFFVTVFISYFTAGLVQVAELIVRRKRKKRIRRTRKQPWPITYRFSLTLNYFYSITDKETIRQLA